MLHRAPLPPLVPLLSPRGDLLSSVLTPVSTLLASEIITCFLLSIDIERKKAPWSPARRAHARADQNVAYYLRAPCRQRLSLGVNFTVWSLYTKTRERDLDYLTRVP